jgi:hypothetical protein
MDKVKVKIESVNIGAKVAEDIIDQTGKVLVKKDTVIDREVLDFLILNSIEEIWVEQSNPVKEKVDEIFSRVKDDEFMKKLYTYVLEFRIKNNL